MGLQGKFCPFCALGAGAGGLFSVLMLIFALAGAAVSSPEAAAAIPSAASGIYAQAALGEASQPGSASPRAPGPAECADAHASCGPGAFAAVHAKPLPLGMAWRASVVAPRGPEQVPVSAVTPYLNVSRSILFQNFRE